MSVFDVAGSRVVVTGAASGIGLGIARAFVGAGAHVLVSDVDADAIRERGAELAALGSGLVLARECDIADDAALSALFEQAARDLGGVDVVFANAGVNEGRTFRVAEGAVDAFPIDTWRRVLDIDLTGTFLTLRHAAAAMKPQRSGSIVVTASSAGLRAEPLVGYAYSAAKAAVVQLVRHTAIELAPFGIRVNGLAPGPIETNIGGPRKRSDEERAAWLNTVPLGRRGTPDDLVGPALLFGSQAGAFLTGSILTVDGGASVLNQAGAAETAAPLPF